MSRMLTLGLLAGFFHPAAASPCWIQNAAASGPTTWLLCRQGGLLVSEDGGAH